tara:strand:- start:8584 stop:9048 length:465 start_codon:yes stop_codon:yes gene_type:complete
MEVTVRCPQCDAALPINVDEAEVKICCQRCGRETRLKGTNAVISDTAVDSCPVCQGNDFYIRKDFDPKTGVAIVATGAIISAVFYYFGQDIIAYGVLGSGALIDLIVYGRLKNVTICYRCHAEFRGAYKRTADVFDLHTADILEPEWERKIRRR